MARQRNQSGNRSFVGASAADTVPRFIGETVGSMELHPGIGGQVLIVIQLAGGNDALNTVVPFADDAYYRARPKLAIQPDKLLKLNDAFGLHPQLKGLRSLYGDGYLGILHGVGYPNPNRSHFRSTEIWETASDAEVRSDTGWLGRYFDHCCAGADPTVGISIGEVLPQSFQAKSPTGVSFERPADYQWTPVTQTASRTAAEAVFAASNNLPSGCTSLPQNDSQLFLHRIALNARVSSHRILEIKPDGDSTAAYPDTPLGKSLQMIAQMIAGGFSTRVYYASQTGYDTHNAQTTTHDRLIGEFGDAVTALCQDLRRTGNFDRVVIFAFSEFGRRVAENGSGGTDHGKAAPVLFLGGRVNPGLLGTFPSLVDLDEGDQRHNVDFRSVYAGILEDWMDADPQSVLGRQFAKTAIFK